MIAIEAVVLIVACAFGWAFLDLTRKLISSTAPPVATTFLLVLGQIPIFVLWAAVDPRTTALDSYLPASGYWLPGLGTTGLNLLANLAFMQSVRLAPMSRTVPLLSLTPVFATLVAIPFVAEWPTLPQSCGILAVVASALVIARGASTPAVEADCAPPPFWRTLSQRGGVLMAFVALCWSVTPSLDKLAMRSAPAPIHALIIVSGCAMGLALVAWQQGNGAAILGLLGNRRALMLTLAAVLIAAFSSGVQLLAFQVAPVGLVETVKRGLGAALALFFGRLVFGEQIGWRRLVAVTVMAAGVALVILY